MGGGAVVKLTGMIEQVDARVPFDVSPVAVVDIALDAIERAQPTLNACTHVLADSARRTARRLERSPAPRGPLHGVPVAVKELFDVRGAPTTGCSDAYSGRVATADAALVAALRRAGAIIVAKTNQHELACGATGLVSSFGPARNPWDTECLAGGSSGGSAVAVASRVVPLGFGTDTGGSLRIPASFCGVTALKPTHGAVNLRGTMPVSPALDTVGPIATTVTDCAVAFGVIRSATCPVMPAASVMCLSGLRVGLPASFFSKVHAETKTAVERAAYVLEQLGAAVEEVDGPELDEDGRGFAFVWGDFADAHRAVWEDPRLHPEVAALLDQGRAMSPSARRRSSERAGQIRATFRRALRRVDHLLCPTTPYAAPPATAEAVAVGSELLDVRRGGPSRLTLPVNLAGLPSLAFPVGFSAQGRPLGAQLIGPPWSEASLLTVGTMYQEATEWHRRLPPWEPMATARHAQYHLRTGA